MKARKKTAKIYKYQERKLGVTPLDKLQIGDEVIVGRAVAKIVGINPIRIKFIRSKFISSKEIHSLPNGIEGLRKIRNFEISKNQSETCEDIIVLEFKPDVDLPNITEFTISQHAVLIKTLKSMGVIRCNLTLKVECPKTMCERICAFIDGYKLAIDKFTGAM